ncbi:MAG: hypothetical protein AABY13_02930, partial [Nanoarchaeota archaeon]
NVSLAEVFNLGVEPALTSEGFVQAYSVDPSQVTFQNGTMTVAAAGHELHKCANYSFTSRTCLGGYVLHMQNLTPGQYYTFNLSAVDPGFGEVNTQIGVYKVYDNWIDKDVTSGAGKGFHRTMITVWNNNSVSMLQRNVSDAYTLANIVSNIAASSPAGATLSGTQLVRWDGQFNVTTKNYSEFRYDWHSDTSNSGATTTTNVRTNASGAQNQTKLYSGINKGGAGGTNAAYLLSQLSADAGGSFVFNIHDINGSSNSTFEMRAESCQFSGKVVISSGIQMTVRIPEGWNVTNAPGWTQSPSACSASTAGCNLTRNATGSEFLDFQGGNRICRNTTATGQAWTATNWQFNATAPQPTTTTEYLFNTTIVYTDSSANIHRTVGEHLVIVNGTPVVDVTPPAITLNFPPNATNATTTSHNFTWTTTNSNSTTACNLTINSVVNISDVSTPNNTPTNRTVSNFIDGTHSWNVSCTDGSNANTSETRTFIVDTRGPALDNRTEDP